MLKKCPYCTRQLPDHSEQDYYFCPFCGKDITEPRQRVLFETIPPDFTVVPEKKDKEEERKEITNLQNHSDKTIPPKPAAKKSRPKLTPPPGPPPKSFYKKSS